MELRINFCTKHMYNKNSNDAFWVQISQQVLCFAFFPQILVTVISRILFHGIVQNLARSMLTLTDDICINFEGTAC